MAGYELPLHVSREPGARWMLKIGRDYSGRYHPGIEPWFDIKLYRNDMLVSGTVAQPLTCMQAVAEGRKTAMLCPGGVLALYLSSDTLMVELHGAEGRHVCAQSRARDYRVLAEQLAQSG